MKKVSALALGVMMMAVFVSGCAKKSASEQLRDDMKKAGKEIDKEAKKFFG